MNYIVKCFWIFIIGCVVGFLWETLLTLVRDRKLESRQGLIFGPFIPVYGIGLLLYYFIVPKMKNPWVIFLVSLVVGGLAEFLFSYFQEKVFGTVSWDYSSQPFNLQGRTSLFCAAFWGAAGVFFAKIVFPFLDPLLDKWMVHNAFRMTTGILMVFMIFNFFVSTLAGVRQRKREQNVEPQTTTDYIMDDLYPNEVMQQKFPNRIFRM